MTSSETIHGACNCGAIKVSLPRTSLPPTISLCHCTGCRASGGSLFAVNIRIPTKDITVTGTPKIYSSLANSGTTTKRHFCGDCGSPIMSVVVENPDMASLKGGLFAETGVELPPPGRHVFWKRAEKWEVAEEGIAVFEGMPN